MSHNNPTQIEKPVSQMRVGIACAQWNGHITSRLTHSAVDTLKKAGVSQADIEVFEVPGAVELTFAASQMVDSVRYDVIFVFGFVVRGETPHFDYVCQSVTQGITILNSDCDIPIIFGVLTVDNEQDALDRAGGCKGDKGAEAAQAAIKMHNFHVKVTEM